MTTIGDAAFSGCGLTSITIPKSVTTIGEAAFAGCSYLTSVTIQEGVEIIRSNAFADCYSLTNITIPESVISIENEAFSYCSALTSVTMLGSSMPYFNNWFWGSETLNKIFVPYGSEADYQKTFNDFHREDYAGSVTGSITIDLKAASIGGAYASAYYPCALTLVEGDAKAYVAEKVDANTLKMTSTNEIAAHSGFILRADKATTATLRVGASEAAATSVLTGTTTEIALTDANRPDYLLFSVSKAVDGKPKELGFFRLSSAVESIAAYKPFLPGTFGESGVRMEFDFPTTGLEEIDAASGGHLSPAYDLTGRPATHLRKGHLYIRNGQKFIAQ